MTEEIDLHEIGKKCTVVVPCYNEKDAVEDTISNLCEIQKQCGLAQIIFVNDGSNDGTKEKLDEMAEKYAIRVIHQPRNRGYGASLKSGIRAAKTEWIIITDADGTYPNQRIPDLIQFTETADMIVGSRTEDTVEYSTLRKIPKWFLRNYASWIARQKIPDMNSGLRVFPRDVAIKYFNILPSGFSFTTTITIAMMTNGYNVHYEPITYKRRIGKSKIRPIKDTLGFAQLILRTGVYFAPLRVFMPFVFILSLCFLASLAYDAIWLGNLTDKTVTIFMFTLNTTLFALIADMIEKRTNM